MRYLLSSSARIFLIVIEIRRLRVLTAVIERYQDLSPIKLAGAIRAGVYMVLSPRRLFLPFPKVNAFDEQPDS